MDAAPFGARPDLRHADPARAVLVTFAVAIPVKEHLHAPVLIGPDLVGFGADDEGGLRAADDGLGCDAFGPKGALAVQHADAAAERFFLSERARLELVRRELELR